MLTPSHSSTLPPPSQMEATCAKLLELGEYGTLVAFVEKWAESQDPTTPARLAQAEALLELRLMDKAWVRLKALVDGGLGGVRPHLLSGRMFIERGWPAKARKVLQEGLERRPDDAELLALLERAQRPPEERDTSRADDEEASAEELISLAEHFMVQGAFVRARSLLERVRRGDEVPHRARQLLMALDGDFELDDPISTLVSRYGVPIVTLSDIGEDSDHTESANLSDLPLQIDRDEPEDRFPSLFRHLDPEAAEATADLDPTQEVTAVSSLADLHQLMDAAANAPDAPGSGDDTQIMRVVHRGWVEAVAPGAAHTNTPEPDASFNLADFQREMGMVPRPLSSDMDFVGPEDEDESVVVVTRANDFDDPDLDAPERPRLQLDSADDDEAARALGINEDEDWHSEEGAPPGLVADPKLEEAASADLPEGEPTVELERPEEPPKPKTAKKKEAPAVPDLDDEPLTYEPSSGLGTWPWWVALIGLVMALGGLLFVLLLLAMLL